MARDPRLHAIAATREALSGSQCLAAVIGARQVCEGFTTLAEDENSRRTRVQPIFGWLAQHGGTDWPARILRLVNGLEASLEPGKLLRLDYLDERRIAPSARRLAWMIRNAELLTPRDGRRWREYRSRVIEHPDRDAALALLDRDLTEGIERKLLLEGPTCADCLIECEHAVIWIEAKRNDWLDYSTTWDVTRDQLARNAEAAWLYAAKRGKDSCLVVCHEHQLKHHEQLLLDGYRTGSWIGGWPHLSACERHALGARIGTITWATLARQWPEIGELLT